jgi:hypothetical protein
MRTTCELRDFVQRCKSREAFANSRRNLAASEISGAASATTAVKPLQPPHSTFASPSFTLQPDSAIAVKLSCSPRCLVKSSNFPVSFSTAKTVKNSLSPNRTVKSSTYRFNLRAK